MENKLEVDNCPKCGDERRIEHGINGLSAECIRCGFREKIKSLDELSKE